MRWCRSSAPIRCAGMVAVVVLGGCGRDLPKGNLFASRTRGLVYLEQDQLREAEAEFRIVIALAPDDPLGYANLGLVHLRAGRLRDAEKELRRALDRDSVDIAPVLTLAKVYDLTGRRANARALLERRLDSLRADPRVLFALAGLADTAPGTTVADRQKYLQRLVAQSPGNLSARLALATDHIRSGQSDAAAQQLEALRQLLPGPPKEALPLYAEALRLLLAGQPDSAGTPFDRFREIMEVTPAYQASFQAVAGPLGPMVGYPVLTFRPYYEIRERVTQMADSTPVAIRFSDGSGYSGLDRMVVAPPGGAVPSGQDPPALAAGDYDGDGAEDLFVGTGHLYRNDYSRFAEVPQTGITPQGPARWAGFADYDNDGRLDLAILGADGGFRLLHNQAGKGREAFRDVTGRARLGDVRGRSAQFVDLDHDGDLDLVLIAETGLRVFRNNLDDSFREVTREAGFESTASTRAYAGVVFGDFSGDGLIDLVVTGAAGGGNLLRNRGELRFEDATAGSGLDITAGAHAVAAGDYDNDGLLDLVLVRSDGEPMRFRGRAGGAFAPDSRPSRTLGSPGGSAFTRVAFLDYDNDGWLDLVLSGATGLSLLRNDGAGGFADYSTLLPDGKRTGGALVTSDVDRDGDVDLVVLGGGGGAGDQLRLLRNDGGNANQYLRVELKALGAGSGKNNAFGIGARLELRAGELYQTRITTAPVTYFGLGAHLKADVIRVVWPNGVPQTIYFPGSDQNVLEEQVLKSSCLFLYAWNGAGFQFVTDVMWRSALGMPVGIGGSGRAAYAPAGASREYLRIAGAQLKPRDGRYTIQLTEELWETSYLDQVRLVAVDHPDSVDVYVDERFVPPAPAALRFYQTTRPRPPLSATDEYGADLLPALLARDDDYTGPLLPGKFQGLTEPHALILDLGPGARGDSVLLVLRGWVFPTDASINVALSQASGPKVVSPSLEVLDARGRWQMAIPDLGFPSGKDKTLIADLTGRFPSADHRVRIRTNMDIHWDQAFIAGSASGSPARVTTLDPAAADLHYRGFSRMYRKGGRSGPHWFDYSDVAAEARWLPITGFLTRFGDVLPLLTGADDRYAVMGPGDEATVEFAADGMPQLPPGWSRDFLIYSVGWIKDGDFNTAHGGSVLPLPFHGMSRYPYPAGESYPGDSVHRSYRETWNTRSAAGPPR